MPWKNPFRRGGRGRNGGWGGGGDGNYHYDGEEDDDDDESEAEALWRIANDPDFDEMDELGFVPHTPRRFDRDDGPDTDKLPVPRHK